MQNYKLLPALLSILKTKNLTDSARELNVTQSAMSKTFRQIRDAFDDQIMVREGNQYLLTSKGVELQTQLPELINKMESLFKPDELDPLKINRQFSLAFSSYVAKSVLPIICSEVEAQAPDVSLVSRYWQEDDFEDFAASDFDILLTVADDVPENLYGKELGTDRYVVMFRNEHPLAKQTLTHENYMQAKHILVNGAVGCDNHLFKNSVNSVNPSRKVFASVPSFYSAIQILLTTDAVMTAPLHIASKFAEKYDLVLHDYPISLPVHKYYLLWHAKYNQDLEHKWFRAICIDLISRDLEGRINFGKNLFKENNLPIN